MTPTDLDFTERRIISNEFLTSLSSTIIQHEYCWTVHTFRSFVIVYPGNYLSTVSTKQSIKLNNSDYFITQLICKNIWLDFIPLYEAFRKSDKTVHSSNHQNLWKLICYAIPSKPSCLWPNDHPTPPPKLQYQALLSCHRQSNSRHEFLSKADNIHCRNVIIGENTLRKQLSL